MLLGPARVLVLLAVLGRLGFPIFRRLAFLDRLVLLARVVLLGRRHDRRVDDLPTPGEIAPVLQEPVKQIEQLFYRVRSRQCFTIEPQSLRVRDRILEPQTKKTNEGETISKLVFRLIVGKIVERLQHQRLEDHDFIPRLASRRSLAFRFAPAKLAFNQRRLQLWPEGFEGNYRPNRYKRIVLFVETFIASVQIKEAKLSHANLPRSEHQNLESDLHGGGKRLFFEVPYNQFGRRPLFVAKLLIFSVGRRPKLFSIPSPLLRS